MSASPLLFYVTRADNSVTGPHVVGIIRRGLASGEFGPDTPLCLNGTEDWLPLSEWEAEIVAPGPAAPTGTAGLSAASAAYVRQLPAPTSKSPLRIFWGVILMLWALGQASATLYYFTSDNPIMLAVSGVATLLLLWLGGRLLTIPRGS